jgi:ankyrin repeat protein
LIMYFISANASLTAENASGIVPLDYLCSTGNDEIVLEVMKYLPDYEYGLLLRLAAEHGIVAAVGRVMDTHAAPVDGEDADQRTAMHFACLNGNADVAKTLIGFGANIRSKDADGMTPILYACSSGNLKLVKYLLAHGSKVLLDDIDAQGNNCLHIACHLGHMDLSQYLVKIGMDCNVMNDQGLNAAASADAAGFGKVDKWVRQAASRIANSGADRGALSQQLLVCASSGAAAEVRRVIDTGVSVNAKSEGGNTPLHAAMACGHVEVARLLFDAAGDANAVNDAGYSPLMVACMAGHLDLVRWLHDIGVDLRAMAGGSDALHYATLLGKIDVVEYLLDNGVDANSADVSGATAMHAACQGNSLDVARLLYERGGDVNAADRYGVTPLHIASFRGHNIIAQWLLFSSVDIECVDSVGRTPFLCACMGGELKTAMLLDEKNADIHASTGAGDSALHLAAFRAHVHVIDWLIGKGLDVSGLNANQQTPYQVSLMSCNKGTTDFFGSYFLQTNIVEPEAVVYQVAYEIFRTTNDSNYPAAFFCLEEIMRRVEPMFRLPGDALILHFAAAAGHVNLIKFLLSKGVPANALSGTGRSPLHYAAIKGHVEAAGVLLAAGADGYAKDSSGKSPLEYALQHQQSKFAQFLQARNDEKLRPASADSPGFFSCLSANSGEGGHGEMFRSMSDDIQAGGGGGSQGEGEVGQCPSIDDIEYTHDGAEGEDWVDAPCPVDVALQRMAVASKHIGDCVPVPAARSASSEFVPLDMASPPADRAQRESLEPETETDAAGKAQGQGQGQEETASTDLHLACSSGSLQHVQTLSGKGVDLDAKNSFGLTPLYIACDKQYGDIAMYLIKKGADLGVVCAPGDTPLHRICARGMSSLLEQIVGGGLSVRLPLDVKSSGGLSLLHVAAKAGFVGVMQVLVKHANVMNARDALGKTALHYVCESGNLEMVDFLLMNGAFLNVRDSEGCTPISLAVISGALEVCEVLSKNGAATTAEDNEGNTLLHIACRSGDVDMIQWLLAGGADKNASNAELRTPINILMDGRFMTALKVFEDY